MESVRTAILNLLPEQTQQRAEEYLVRRFDLWDRNQEALEALIPNVTLAYMDMIFNADVMLLVEERQRKCSGCSPSLWEWVPDGIALEPSRRSCTEPLRPVVTRDREGKEIPQGCGVVRLRLRWIPCQTYQDWRKLHANPEPSERRRGKTHGTYRKTGRWEQRAN